MSGILNVVNVVRYYLVMETYFPDQLSTHAINFSTTRYSSSQGEAVRARTRAIPYLSPFRAAPLFWGGDNEIKFQANCPPKREQCGSKTVEIGDCGMCVPGEIGSR